MSNNFPEGFSKINPTIRKSIGDYIANDPAELYAKIRHDIVHNPDDLNNRSLSLGNAVGRHITATSLAEYSAPERSYVSTIVGAGTHDVHRVYNFLQEDVGPISMHEALAFTESPMTSLALAQIAVHHSLDIKRIIGSEKRSSYFYFDKQRQALLLGSQFSEKHKEVGCPYAFDQSQPRVQPIFNRFTQWAGRLSLEDLYAEQELPVPIHVNLK